MARKSPSQTPALNQFLARQDSARRWHQDRESYDWLVHVGGPVQVTLGDVVELASTRWHASFYPVLSQPQASRMQEYSSEVEALVHYLMPAIDVVGVRWEVCATLASIDGLPVTAVLSGTAQSLEIALTSLERANIGPFDWNGLNWYRDTDSGNSFVTVFDGDELRIQQGPEPCTTSWSWELHSRLLNRIARSLGYLAFPLGGKAATQHEAQRAAMVAAARVLPESIALLRGQVSQQLLEREVDEGAIDSDAPIILSTAERQALAKVLEELPSNHSPFEIFNGLGTTGLLREAIEKLSLSALQHTAPRTTN